jgi:L-fucose isomerase
MKKDTEMLRRLGLLSFSDGRERVHKDLEERIHQVASEIKSALERTGEIEVIPAEKIITSSELAKEEAQKMACKGIDGTLFNLSVFAFPNFPVIAAENGKGPYLFYTPTFGKLPGLGGLLAGAGSLRQVGLKCEKVYGDLSDERIVRKLLAFSRAATVFNRLKGSVFGLIGGRSIGMLTGANDGALWHNKFGVDTEHIDQLEIIRLADQMSQESVDKAFRWMKENLGGIAFDGKKLTEETLQYQIRCYLAIKKIIQDRKLDFTAVKCHYELSEYYVTQCLGVTFFNDPYDWDGPKEPFVFSCEADADGALTMQILKLISGKPVLFFDIRHYDQKEGIFVFCNCGGMSSWYAERAEDPKQNLKKVHLYPTISKYAGGGAHVQFVCKEGEMTLARLSRSLNQYEMLITKGTFKRYPLEKLKETAWEWPHAFAQLDIESDKLIEKMNSNHLHAVEGDYVPELERVCEMLEIHPVLL